jgi:hypothetical protein
VPAWAALPEAQWVATWQMTAATIDLTASDMGTRKTSMIDSPAICSHTSNRAI